MIKTVVEKIKLVDSSFVSNPRDLYVRTSVEKLMSIA